MYKKRVIFLLIILVLILGSACGTTDVKVDNFTSKEQIQTEIKMPESNPDLVGKVKEIIGNEVTVYKVNIDLSQKGSNKEPNNNKDQRLEARGPRFKVSEETETFIIPVGTPIVIRQRGSKENNTIELTEIKKDQFLRIWRINDTVEFVQLMGGGAGRTGTGEGQRSNQGGIPVGMGGGPPQ